MPITAQGFEARRFSEIVETINTNQRANIASDLNTSPDTLLGALTAIFAASISDQEELLAATADNFNIDKAEGTHLDDLVALVGISRLDAAPTSGRLEATGANLTNIPVGTEFSDGTNTFRSTSATILAENQCIRAVYTLDTVITGTEYSLTINNVRYSYTAVAGNTSNIILLQLANMINEDTSNVSSSATYNSVANSLTVSTSQTLVNLSIIPSSFLITNDITGVVFIENTVNGPVEVAAGAVTTIRSSVTGLNSVTNPIPLNTGRVAETDEQLRARQAISVRMAGTATVPAIQAALLEVEGVTDADVIENTSTTSDTEGRPGKSYEVVVTGGVSTDIAQTIFNTKPAGIQTYGDFRNIVTFGGTDYEVFFSRPVSVYIWAQIDYTLYDEEAFPPNGEQGIANAFVQFGSELNNNDDVIPKRSYRNIYSSVSGIDDLTVRIASSTSPTTPPADGAYSETTIPISARQLAVFDASRVTVSLS